MYSVVYVIQHKWIMLGGYSNLLAAVIQNSIHLTIQQHSRSLTLTQTIHQFLLLCWVSAWYHPNHTITVNAKMIQCICPDTHIHSCWLHTPYCASKRLLPHTLTTILVIKVCCIFLGNLGIYYEIWEHFNITKRSLTGQSNRSGKKTPG